MRAPLSIFIPVFMFSSIFASLSGSRLNSIGEDHAPCLTPFSMWKVSVYPPFILSVLCSFWYASFRMSLTVCSMPVSCRMSKSISLLTLSNAFLRSISITCSSYPLVSCICASISSVSMWSAVLLFFLKPYYGSARYAVLSMWLVSFVASILSRTLYHMFVRDIGLWSSGFFGSFASLGRRTIMAFPSSSGTFLVSHM